MSKILPGVFNEFSLPSYTFRRLDPEDATELYELIKSQPAEDLKYFGPHRFELNAIKKQFSNRAFLMMGSYDKDKLMGYFFLRFFANKKCFVGRLIDSQYRGKGIGRVMNNIMYETAWRMNFSCLSTISKNNKAVIQAHSKNQAMKVLKELNNDYLLVEFVKRN